MLLLLLLLLLLLMLLLLQNLVLPEARVQPLVPLLGCDVQAKMLLFVGALRKTLAGGRGRVWPAPSPEQPSKWEDRSSLAHIHRFQHRMSSNTWHQNISRPGQLGRCGIEPRKCRGTNRSPPLHGTASLGRAQEYVVVTGEQQILQVRSGTGRWRASSHSPS
jgi:hypothetical protein